MDYDLIRQKRHDAVERISAKKKELNEAAYKEAESKRRLTILHRLQWRNEIKGRRLKELETQLDNYVIRNIEKYFDDVNNSINDFENCDWDSIVEEIAINNNSKYKIRNNIKLPRESIRIHSSKYPITNKFEEKFCSLKFSYDKVLFTGSNSILKSNKSERGLSFASPLSIGLSNTVFITPANINITDENKEINEEKGNKGNTTQSVSYNTQVDTIINDNPDECRLVESLFLVGPSKEDIIKNLKNNSKNMLDNEYSSYLEPKMIYNVGTDPDIESEALPWFCFPMGVKFILSKSPLPEDKKNASKTFVFLLSGHTSSQFSISLTVNRSFAIEFQGINYYVTTEYCISAVTHLPFLSYISYILQQCNFMGWILSNLSQPLDENFSVKTSHDILAIEAIQIIDDLATRLRRLYVYYPCEDSDSVLNVFTPIDMKLVLRNSANNATSKGIFVSLRRDIQQLYYRYPNSTPGTLCVDRDREVTYNVLLWALPILLRHLPLSEIALVVGCALSEMRIVVHSPDLSAISGVLLTIVYLLRPFKWAGPIIVTLPHTLHTFLESPVPLILGMQSLPVGFTTEAGVVVVDAQERVVNLHPTDTVVSHTLILPKVSALITELMSPAENILKLTRKNDKDFNDYQGNNILPLPIDLNSDSTKGKSLLESVMQFIHIFETHIQTIINTAVIHSWEERRQLRQQLKPKIVSSKSGSMKRFGSSNKSPEKSNNSSPEKISITKSEKYKSGFFTNSDDGNISDTDDMSIDLPHVTEDAPKLLVQRGKNDHFISRIRTTQMYSNYCRMASQLLNSDNINNDDNNNDDDDNSSSNPSNGQNKFMSPNDIKTQEIVAAVVATNRKSFSIQQDGDKGSPYTGIMRKRSSSTAARLNDISNKEYILNPQTTEHDPLTLLFHIIINGSIPRSKDIIIQSQGEININTIWCNGRCDGKANTPLCTKICLRQWEECANIAQKNKKIKELHDRLQLTRIEPIKHSKETISQYNKRCSEVLHRNISSINNNETDNIDKKVYQSLAKFYNKRIQKIKLNHAAYLITSFMKKILSFMKYIKEYRKALIIQKYYRGYYIRHNYTNLVKKLKLAKIKKLSAIIILKRFFKNIGASISIQDELIIKNGSQSNKFNNTTINNEYIESSRSFSSPVILSSHTNNDMNNDTNNHYENKTRQSNVSYLGDRANKMLNRFLHRQASQHTATKKSSFSINKEDKINEEEEEVQESEKFEEDSTRWSSPISQNSIDSYDHITPISDDKNLLINSNSPSINNITNSIEGIRRISVTSQAAVAITETGLKLDKDILMNQNKNEITTTISSIPTISITNDLNKEINSTTSSPKNIDNNNNNNISIDNTDKEIVDLLVNIDNNNKNNDQPLLLSNINLTTYAITPQQCRMITDMWKVLRKGVVVMKHSKHGKPHKRYLYCNDALSLLYWRETQEISDIEYTSNDNHKKKAHMISFEKDNTEREVYITNILEVRDDIHTDVMHRSFSKKLLAGDSSTGVISLILKNNKSLDLEVEDAYWGRIYHALKVLVNYYQIILPSLNESVKL